MNVLGFDTSTAATTAGVVRGGGEPVERDLPPAEPPAHARELLPAIVDAMEEAGLAYADLDAVAVGVGPGTFTGLRIGVATARAIASAAQVELRPVSSLAALARGIEGDPALALIDARRGELFAALYDAGERRFGPVAEPPEALIERVRKTGLDPLAAGDGSVRFRGVLEAAGIRVEPEGSRAHAVRALHICRLAADAQATPPEAVLPEYVRSPDAKPRER